MQEKRSNAEAAPMTQDERDFVVTRIINAPQALVFAAWTEPKHMAQWWGPHTFTNPVCEMDVCPGGAWRIVMRGPDGALHPAQGVYRAVSPPGRLVFTINHSELSDEWHDMVNPSRDKTAGKPPLEADVTVTFEDQGGKTKLTIRMRFESAAVRDALLKIGMSQGWSQSLERLAEVVAKKTEPVVIERTLNAPVAQVWKALTVNDEMKRWYFVLPEFKAEVGFEFQFAAEHEGAKYDHRCVVKEVIPEKKLAYSWRYEGEVGDSLVTFELFAEGNQTRLKLTHEGLETFPKTPAYARANFEAGWTAIIGTALKHFVEKGASK